MPGESSGISVSDPRVVVTAVKASCDHTSLVVRAFNASDDTVAFAHAWDFLFSTPV